MSKLRIVVLIIVVTIGALVAFGQQSINEAKDRGCVDAEVAINHLSYVEATAKCEHEG